MLSHIINFLIDFTFYGSFACAIGFFIGERLANKARENESDAYNKHIMELNKTIIELKKKLNNKPTRKSKS